MKRVLVLNRCYLPVHITSVKRAIQMLYLGAARGVDPEYKTFSWEDLCAELSKHPNPENENVHFLRSLQGWIAIPKVIVLNHYDRLPQRNIRFSRTHVFMRDQYTCQYCANEFPKIKLNLDHVLPKSRGGRTSWDNLVTSCHDCNRTKADRTPQEAKMPLLKKPRKPAGTFGLINLKQVHASWSPFLLTDN